MKPSRKLLSSVIFFTMSSHMVQAASDITISGSTDSDITLSTPFKDATDNGGPSNLSVITLTGALGSSNVVVSTNTSSGPVNGNITVIDSVTWGSSNSLTLSADTNIAVGATINSIGGGALNLNSGGTVSFDADVLLSGPSGGLTVNSSGVSQTVPRKVEVDGPADINAGAGAITLLSENKFGTLKLAGGTVAVHEADATVLTGVSASSLTLTSAGTITDAPNTTINVTGLANLNAGSNAITLGDNPGDSTNFGSLNLTGTAVAITEDSSSELAGVAATSLSLNSNGAITDSGNIGVTGLATLNSNGGAITLGDNAGETTNFGSLNINGGAVSISEDSSMDLTGSNTATSATLSSSGALSDATATSVDVSGQGSFSGSSISLGGGTFNTGSLTFNSPGAVSIAEDSGMNITGVNTGGATNLSSTAGVSDAGATSVNVGALTVSGTSINLGGGTFNATTTNFNSAGPVMIAEDSSTDLVGVNTAGSATLSSTGALSDAGATSVTVNGLGSFSGASISLGGGTFNTGSLNFNSAGSVVVSEDSSTNLSGASTAGSLNLNSTAGITDQSGSLGVNGGANITAGGNTSIVLDDTAISVGGNTVLTAGSGQDIVVNNSANNFTGTVNFVASTGTLANVNVADTSAFDLQALTVTNSLTAVSGGELTDSGNLAVGGLATLGGASINIGGAGETTNFGSLKFNSTGVVAIQEDSSTLLSGTSTGSTLALTSAAGITNDASANVTVTNNANFAGTSITLGTTAGDSMNFGSLTFNAAGAVAISEDSSTLLSGTSTGSTLALTSAAGITNDATTNLTVTNNANLSGASITLGTTAGDAVNFGSLTFNSAGAVAVSEDSSTLLTGTSTGQSVALTSTAAITNDATANLTVANNASFAGTSITLGTTAGDSMNFGSLTFNSAGTVAISEDSSTVLSGTSTGSTLTLNSTAGITNDATTHLDVTNNANLTAASITLGTTAGDSVNFGSLTFNSAGAVAISEDSSTLLTGASTGSSLALSSAAGITNDASANLAVTNNASFNGSSITLGTTAGDAMNFGSLTFGSAGAVAVSEDSSTLLSGTSTASTLALTSAAGITNDASANLNVTNNANLNGSSITLGTTPGDSVNFGSLTFASAGPVTVSENSSMDIVGVNQGGATTLSSTAGISDAGATSVNVGALTVSGTSINLGGGTFNATTLNFNSPGAVNIAEDSSTDIVGANTAASATLSSTAAISDAGATSVDIAGLGNFSGTSINLGGGTFNTGSLKFNSTGVVTVAEDSSTLLSGTSTAQSLTLSSTAAITNDATTHLTVTGNADLSGTSISLGSVGGDTVDFGSLTFHSPGAVSIKENSSTALTGTSTANSLTLNSAGALTDGGNLSVTGLATLSGTSIMIGGTGQTTNFGSLNVNSAGAVGIEEDSDTSFVGANTANVLTLTSSGVSTFTAGSTLDAVTLDVKTSGVVLTGNNLVDTMEVKLDDGTTLTLDGSDTIAKLTSTGGIIAGTGTLTATGSATLSGGTVSGHLLGDTTTTDSVLVSGTIGGGFLHVDNGVLTLTGTSTNTPVEIALNAQLIDSNGGLDSAAVVTNAGLLTVNSADTVKSYTQNGGTLAGSAALTVTDGAALNGGTISGQLLGDIISTGGLLVSGSIGGGSLIVASGTLTLTGTSTNTPVDISAGAELIDSNGGLDAAAVVTNAGLLTVNGADTVKTYTQNGSGTLAGSAALTATDGATLNGGTISGQLLADTISTGAVDVSGSIGGGFLHVTGGELTFTGTSTNTPVEISSGAALTDVNGGLDSSAVVTNAGLLTVNAADTVNLYTQNGTGTLAGSSALTATTGAILNGGTVSGQLLGNTVSTGAVDVSGSIGGGFLQVTSGVLTLTGTSTNNLVEIASGAALTDSSGGLDSFAAVENAGLLTVNSADTVQTYTQNGTGTLAGGAALTATEGATLNGGTVSGQLLGDTLSTGPVLVSGSVGGGSLTVASGTLTLTGTSTNTAVDIASGAALLDSNGGLYSSAAVTNFGLLTVDGADTVLTYTQKVNGILAGAEALTATNGAELNGGTISGHLLGDTISTANVLVSGTVGGGSLGVMSGTLTLTGSSTNNLVSISSGATLLDSNGGLDDSADLTNAGRLTVNSDDTVLTYTQSGPDTPVVAQSSGSQFASSPVGGILDGSATLTATGGATLEGGKILGHLLADTTVTGDVLVAGTVGGGFVHVDSGILTLTGTLNSPTLVKAPGTLKGTGLVNGNLRNFGTLAVGSSGDKLTISGSLFTRGSIELSLENSGEFEQIKAGSVNLGGALVVTNTGSGLAVGDTAQVIEAGAYSNGVANFTSVGFDNGVLFNDRTGTLIGLAGGSSGSGGGYLNLNGNQTSTYIALFDDSVQPGVKNVTRVKNPTGPGYIINFTSGATNGDSQLVTALYQATFSTPGSIDADTMNSLSPEAHHGMVDYTEQALRSHVREAVDTAPVARNGKTQVFATVHTTSDGVDSTETDAGYDLEMNGATAGVRYDVNKDFQIGGLLGLDDGSIKGPHIDTDAQGLVLGTFGTYKFGDSHQTKLTGVAAYGSYSYDAARRSFGGDATADGIGSDAVELSLGVSTVLYEKDGFRLSPSASLTYVGGSVDSFKEQGPGVPLAVESQDINSVLFDVGFDISYQITQRLSIGGRVGYVSDLSGSDDSVTSTFAATGSAAVPFTVSAPGIDNQAATLGLGLYYDINDSTRVGFTYHGEFRSGSESSQTFGIGASYGF